MKKIEDYLHLYLGCTVWDSYNDRKGKLVKVSTVGVGVLGTSVVWEFEFSEIKLILRPLSDITNEEVKEFANWEAGMTLVKFKSDELMLELQYLNIGERETTFYHYYWRQISARQFHYLLSKGFDLFNLIPEGLAIDKTKL